MTSLRPLVVIPGMFGSELRDDAGHVLWGNALRFFSGPPIGRRGQPLVGGPSRVMEHVRIVPGIVYPLVGGLVGALENAGYRRGDTLDLFAYDWRLPFLELGAVLAQRVRALASARGSRVDILGLSTGGLMTRVAMALDADLPVERVVCSGTPHAGTLETLACIHHGFRFAPLGRVVDAKQFLACPGATDCLPAVDTPAGGLFLDGPRDLYDVATWRELRLGVFAHATGSEIDEWTTSLSGSLQATRTLWQTVARTPAPPVLVCVAGVGLPTQLRVPVEGSVAVMPGEGNVRGLPERALGDGDGGIAVESAVAWPDAEPRVVRVAVKRHRDMVRSAGVLTAILAALST